MQDERNVAETTDVRWQVTTPIGRRLVCRVCVTQGNIVVRLTASDALLRADRVPSLEEATVLTRRWLHAVVSTQSATTDNSATA